MESEAFEVQVLPGDGYGKSHCLVTPSGSGRSVNNVRKDKLLASQAAGARSLDIDDASTARTALSTEADDMSTLREKFSYGSLTFETPGGTFNSPACSFDAAGIARVRPKHQGDILRISEPDGGGGAVNKENKSTSDYVNASLMDLDDDDDDCSDGGGIKTTLENKLASEGGRASFLRVGEHSDFATAGRFVGDTSTSFDSHADFYDGPSFAVTPASIAGRTLRTSQSRAQFYRGYGQSGIMSPGGVAANNVLDQSESRAQFYGADNVRSSGSVFQNGTLKTDSRIGLYRVTCSETTGPLSCREKVTQPALENFWEDKTEEGNQTSEKKHKEKKNSINQGEKSGSFFSAVTCCFMPDQS